MEEILQENAADRPEKEGPSLCGQECRCETTPSIASGPQTSQAMMTDGVLNRAIDEFDRLAMSLMKLKNSSGDVSLTSYSSQCFPVERASAVKHTPPSRIRAWIIGDNCSEILAALSSLGVVSSNVRLWNNLRRSDGP